MRRRNRPGCLGLKALAALLLAAAITFLAVLQHSTTTLPPRALVKSESKASGALRAVRAADADHASQAKGDDERREELNQALRARAQAADAAASAAQAREQASNARAAAAERRAVQAEAALEAREQARNATQFLKCTHRTKAYGAAWLARTELLKRQRMSQDKNALEYASFHILTESIRLGATALKAADDSFWVNHVSGYEHAVSKREGADVAENNVNAMVRVLTDKLCIPRTTTPPTSTLALIPFYSGLARDGALHRACIIHAQRAVRAAGGSVEASYCHPARAGVRCQGLGPDKRCWTEASCEPDPRPALREARLRGWTRCTRTRGIDKDLPNTGTAHSMSSGATKLKTLKAVLCSVLSFCKAALVGVCTSRDYESVTELLGTLPAGQARAVLLNCEQAPAYLPYKLLRLVQRHAKGTLNASRVAPAARGVVPWISELDFDFVLYDEADQTLHFEGTALRDVFDVLTQHPDYYVAPQRYEKGWGGIPRFVLQGNLSRTMNKCDPKLPRLAYT